MKQINLVPLSVRQKSATRQTVPLLVVAALVGIGAAGAAWVGFTFQVRTLNVQKEDLIQKETERQQAAAQSSANLTVSPDLTARVVALNSLAKSDVDWNKAFAYVAALLPKEISLSNYSYATTQGLMTLKITGLAPSNVSYATFAEFLKQSKGKTITDFRVEGYSYTPATGTVVFSVVITVPQGQLSFPAS